MTVMYANLALVFVLSYLARHFSYRPARLVGQAFIAKPNKWLVFAVMTSMVLVAGLQNNIGDTYYYMHSYNITQFNLETIKFEGDFGFNLYQMVLQSISSDPQLLIFTTALFTHVLIIVVFYNYVKLFELSVYLFIASGLYTVSMNGIRQFLASAIIFAGTKYLIEGNFKRFVIIVLFASTIHTSAIIFLPIYFVVRMRAWSKPTFILIACAVLLIVAYNEFSDLLFTTIEGSQYGHYKDFEEGGSSWMRVLVYSIPLVIAYFGREKLKRILPGSDVFVNLTVLNAIIVLIATQNWIFARFSIYFGLYNVVLIAWLTFLFRKKDQKLIYYAIILFYFIYFYYEQVISLGLRYGSNYLNF